MIAENLTGVAEVCYLSPMQRGMLFHSLLAPESGVYVEQVSCRLDNCDADLLRAAWHQTIARHDALRAAFVWEGVDEPVQVIHDEVTPPWTVDDWRGLSPEVCESLFEARLDADRSQGFALHEPPLMRFSLFRTGDRSYRFVWTHHHLLLDGWSLRIVFNEVAAHYDAALRGETPSLPRPRSYRDFIAWIEQQDPERAEAFWRTRLGDLCEPAAPLGIECPPTRPTDQAPPVVETVSALSPELTLRLETLARTLRITFYSLIQGAWAVMLNRYTGRQSVVFGCTVSGRPADLHGVERMAGLFINTIPVRVFADPEANVSQWLRAIHADLAAAEPYSWCPLTSIQGWTGVPGGSSLFESLVVFENAPRQESGSGLHIEVSGFRSSYKTNYPVNLIAGIEDGRLVLRIDIDSARIGDEAAGPRLLGHLETVLESMIANADGNVGELRIENTDAHDAWNDTVREFPQCGLAELFEETVSANATRFAAIFGEQRLTYTDLNEGANRLAWYLRRQGVGPESLVGMSVDEGLDAVVTMLAVIKAGGAYAPLRPEDPRRDELALRMRGDGLQWLVVSSGTATLDGIQTISLEADAAAIGAGSAENPPIVSGAANLAYVIHTSGSTGLPKGIAIPQAGVVRLVRNTDYLQVLPGMRIGQISTYAFDAITFEVWGALLNGGCLLEVPRAVKLDPRRLAAHVREQGIEAMFLTAALFNQVISDEPAAFATMKTLLAGGEALTPRPVEEALRYGAPERLLNGYGPTECTTFALWHEIRRTDVGASVPVGKPLANTTAYVVGAELREQPVGVLGEIWLGGPGLARCYLNAARMTAEQFVPDPFSKQPGCRLYRTGDLARRREDGTIDYAGRRDTQIKLRGFRIEPGEIEAALKSYPGVRDAVVLLREGRLAAWAAMSGDVCAKDLRRHLEGRLPEYMVPAAIAILPSLPLNNNGKIDRQALPEIAAEPGSVESGSDTILEIVRGLFADVLGMASVPPDGHFFELGGHSLSATQLISRVRDTLTVEVELRGLFEHPSPEGVARLVREARATDPELALAPPIEPVRDGSDPVLSFAQERLWFLNQLEPESPFYNTPGLVRLEGVLDSRALLSAFRKIVARHEVLRTRYENRGGKPFPVVDEALANLPVQESDLTGLEPGARDEEARRIAAVEVRKPFDLAAGPVFRFRLLTLGAREHLLIVVMHHIVSDGWSMGVLVGEVATLYRAFAEGREPDLDPLRIQYSDFAAWQRKWLQGTVLARQFEYWKTKLAGVPPALPLPTDRPRPRVQSFRGSTMAFQIDARVAEPLRKLGRRNGATPFMVLLTGFAVLLHRFSGQRDLVIGSPIANRNRTGIEPLIGFFVNTLALRVELDRDATFEELLERVRDTALEAFDRQDLPFERLVEELQPERDLSRSPLFQVMFTMQNAPAGELLLPDLTIRPVAPDQPSALFDLSMDMWSNGGGFQGTLEYSTDLFDDEAAARIIACFGRLLEAVAEDPGLAISTVPLLTESERKKVLAFGDGGALDYPRESVGVLVERQAEKTPDVLAVSHNGVGISYAELNRRANRIAHWLRQRGVKPNELVGVLEERGLNYACAVLGILKSGGAFVPFDPGYPAERVRYMVSDSAVRILLAGETLPERYELGAEQLRVALCFGGEARRHGALEIVPFTALDSFSGENPDPVNRPEDTAYGMYTSGSTGLPKAALVRHNGAVNHVYAEAHELKMHAGTVFLQSAPASSDISVWQYLGPWLLGGRTVVVDAPVVCDAPRLFDTIRQAGITLIELVPAVLQELLHHAGSLSPAARVLPSLECAMVTGESAPVSLINRWFEIYPNIPLVNAYGPTEAADDNCQAKYTGPLRADLASAPIGRPLANLNIYVLDSKLQLVPMGVPGEICVAGIGVGKGYWKRDELTRASFVSNPHPGSGRVIYRTGDLGRWRADGQLEFAGRIDQQVKLRGFRVETGEIEAALLQHPAVRDAVVALAGPEENRRLLAWLTPNADGGGALPLQQLETEQLSLWESLHDNSYRDTAGSDPEFNTIGWDSNYTRNPLSEAEMREYVGYTVQRVLRNRPARILEIGCGTGLLSYPLARQCSEYYGTDLSSSAIDRLALQAREQGLLNARFVQQYAHDFEGIPGEFDAILLASVIQYFPGPSYFLRVISGALDRLKQGGAIHVTDVRSLPLLRAFHASVQFYRAADDLDSEELKRRVSAHLRREQELAFDPALFRQLVARFPKIRRVEIAPKRGSLDNEMTRFRYDVSIYTEPSTAASQEWRDAHATDIDGIHAMLSAKPETLALRRIPNARTSAETRLVYLLDQTASTRTVGSIREALNAQRLPGLHPETLMKLGHEHGYELRLSQWESRSDGAFDAVFFQAGQPEPCFFESPDARPLSSLVNNPLSEKLQAVLAPMIRDFLKDRLPGHMIPSQYMVLESLPLGPSGKVDRTGLPAPDEMPSGIEYAAPSNDLERRIVAIWSEVLELPAEKIGINDNFFVLGGHSLKATRVASRIQRDLGVEMPVREIFSAPTVAELARSVPRLARGGFEPIAPALEQADYPLSPVQRAIWMHAQLHGATGMYNMPSARIITGKLNVPALERAFAAVLSRHESLRTAIVERGGEGVQKIVPQPAARIVYSQSTGASDEALRKMVEREALRPLNEGAGETIHAMLVRVGENRHLFLTVVSHLVFDGVSETLFVRDLTRAYELALRDRRCVLPALAIQYKDYTLWRRRAQTASIDYWLNALSPAPPALNLPCDRPRQAERTWAGRVKSVELGQKLSERLREFAAASGTSVYVVLVSAVAALLNRYSGQTDMVLGAPSDGRNHPDLEDQIGLYVNVLPLRCRVSGNDTFSKLVARIAGTLAGSLQHGDFSLDELIARGLNLQRLPGRLPLVEAVVSLQREEGAQASATGVQIEKFEYDFPISQFDAGFYFSETASGLCLEMRYCSELFEADTIARLVRRFVGIAAGAMATPAVPLSEVRIEGAVTWSPSGRVSVPAVSPHQERIWFIEQFETASVYDAQPAYHTIPLLIEFDAPVDTGVLEDALQSVLGAHDELRVRIVTRNGAPEKIRCATDRLKLEWSDSDRPAALAFARQPIGVDSDPPMRAGVFAGGTLLALSLQHAFADAVSVRQIANEIRMAVQALGSGAAPAPIRATIDGGSVAAWQRECPPDALEAARFYFQSRLRGYEEPLRLPEDHPRLAVHYYQSATVSFRAGTYGGVDSHFVMAAFGTLLFHYSRQQRMTIGWMHRNRSRETENTVGSLANMLPICLDIRPEICFAELAAHAGSRIAEAEEFASVPFDRLVRAIQPRVDMSRTALFDVLLRYENVGEGESESGFGYGKYDLQLVALRQPGGIEFIFVYNATLFEAATMERMMRHFGAILDKVAEQPAILTADIQLLDSGDLKRELNFWNPPAEWPQGETIVTLFEEQARRHGGSEALGMGQSRLTYSELNARANRLAHYLLARGVGSQELVGVCLDRSPDLIAVLLGILKAGAAYLPLSPDLPADRIGLMAEDAGLRHWVGSRATAAKAPDGLVSAVVLDRDAMGIQGCSSENPGMHQDGANLAYCLFTSGSTGRPKGVLVEHRNVVRLLYNSAFQFEFSERDVWTMFHSASFDFSVWEMFGALLYGGRLVIIPRETTTDPDLFAGLLARENVTVLNQTPGAFYHLIPATAMYPELALRYVIFGGEALQPVQLRDFHQRFPAVRIVNMYGITETTVHVTFKAIGQAEIKANSPSVGVPIPTTTVYIMDDKQRLLPPGAPGEICVGGAGVARGYLNRPDLTAARFFRNPLRPEERLYRSGDRGRRLAGGEIAYLGRIDSQVQIRGFRVEMGEVEEALASCPGVQQGAVIARDQNNTQSLIGYYAPPLGMATPPVEAVRAHLRKRLPEYMLPGILIPMRHLPVTDNGKVDRAALPPPETFAPVHTEELQLPSNDMEERIGEVWKKVLGRDTIGVNQNFFDAGGDSLRLVQVRVGVREMLGKDIPVADLFRHPTITGLAKHLSAAPGETDGDVKTAADDRAAKRRTARARKAAGR